MTRKSLFGLSAILLLLAGCEGAGENAGSALREPSGADSDTHHSDIDQKSGEAKLQKPVSDRPEILREQAEARIAAERQLCLASFSASSPYYHQLCACASDRLRDAFEQGMLSPDTATIDREAKKIRDSCSN